MNRNNVAIFGMGYVGLTLAIALAKKNFHVTGIEKNAKILDSLKNSKPHFYEHKLQNYLKKYNNKNLSFVENIENCKKIKTFIVAVGTPLDKNKKPKLNHLKEVAKYLNANVKKNDLIIFRSTVPIGTIRNSLLPILSKKNINIAYCPERTAQGCAIEELEKLTQIVSGVNKASCAAANNFFSKITKKTLMVRNIETAEAIKLIDNTQRDTFFSYANEISNICSELGVSAFEVLSNASSNYPRTKRVLPGPVGGPCLSKDSYLLLSNKKIENYKKKSLIFKARKINENLSESLKKCLNLNGKIFSKTRKLKVLLVGLGFKGYPITDDIRGSISLEIIKIVNKLFKSKETFGYDPYVTDEIFIKYPIKKLSKNEIKKHKFDLIINCSNNEYFLKIFKAGNIRMHKNSLIFDFWSRINNFSKVINKKSKCFLINYGSEYNIKYL